ncbi:hypothetical protein ABZ815_51640 [Nonomuraea sp. NPDC047529]|uniref:hypothetical protein n=1 Tax=Nonomuraea sp. NPDC047529 TaxID=3155623 RepID=UPI0033E3BDA3
MLKRFIPAAVAAISLAGLTFTPSASAEALSSYKAYGCAAGDFCVYSTEVISEGTKISIGRGENWPAEDDKWSSVSASPYKNVRSFFNNGKIDTYDHVWVIYIYGDGTGAARCIHRAVDGDLGQGHEYTDLRMPATVVRIEWRKENCEK